MPEPENLTDQQYWEAYHRHHVEGPSPDLAARIYQKTEGYAPLFAKLNLEPGCKLLELGGFPGRIGARLAQMFQAEIRAIDFNPNADSFYAHCTALGVTQAQYSCSDLFQIEPEPLYDLVFSFGLVEHFNNFREIMDLHAAWTKPGGQILIVLPNHRKMAYCYRRFFDANNLSHHNTKAMDLRHFDEMANRLGLELVEKGCVGPFLTNPHRPLSGFKAILHGGVRRVAKRLNPWLLRHPNTWLSANLFGHFRKP